jgi:UDPglucose 6-dehydrogenase
MYDALNKADALLVVTEWPEFRVLNFDEVAKRLNKKVVFDGRNIFDANDMKKMGYDYYCIGIRAK